MSKQKNQLTGNNTKREVDKNIEDEENTKIKPVFILGFVLYVAFASVSLLAFIYWSNKLQGGK